MDMWVKKKLQKKKNDRQRMLLSYMYVIPHISSGKTSILMFLFECDYVKEYIYILQEIKNTHIYYKNRYSCVICFLWNSRQNRIENILLSFFYFYFYKPDCILATSFLCIR